MIKRRYIGKCSSFTHLTSNGKIIKRTTTAFILSIYTVWKWEFRVAKMIGETDKFEQSKAVLDLAISVKVWLNGGPLPPLDDDGKIRNAQLRVIK